MCLSVNSTYVFGAEMWALIFRKARRRNQNTTSAIEGYHAALKSNLMASKQKLRGRAVAWLIYALIHQIEPECRRHTALKLVRQSPCPYFKYNSIKMVRGPCQIILLNYYVPCSTIYVPCSCIRTPCFHSPRDISHYMPSFFYVSPLQC
jgi:hypothetical protein